MAILYLVCGCPAAGKSYYINENIEEDFQSHVSRNDIRLSIIKENENLYSKETMIYNKFIAEICDGLEDGFDVYAEDANTTVLARRKLLNRIPQNLIDEVHVVYIKEHITTCKVQNEKRKGTREYLEPAVISKMYNDMEEPTIEEGFDKIIIVEHNKVTEVIERGE